LNTKIKPKKSIQFAENCPKINRIEFGIISICTVLVLIQLYSNYNLLVFLSQIPHEEWLLMDILVTLLPLTLLSIASLLFWIKKKIGWILLYGINILLLIDYIGLLLHHIEQLSISEYACISYRISLSMYLPYLIIHVSLLIILMSKPIRIRYRVSLNSILLSILTAGILIPVTHFYSYLIWPILN